jgi:glycine dehydrogenase subunit 1
MPFIEHSDVDVKSMLETIGVESIDELFADIPGALRHKGPLGLPEPLSEMELVEHMAALAEKNTPATRLTSFLGAGTYDHYIPAVVDSASSRGEFFTAYTPYQAEASQGTLQTIFEFQTMIARLTGMDAANASMYDGASALAEACAMAHFLFPKKKRIVISGGVHPEYRETVETYLGTLDVELVTIPLDDGQTDIDKLKEKLDETVAVVFQQPNFLGVIEDAQAIADAAHEAGALVIASVDPVSLGLLKPPGEYGADIVIGEGQPLGNPIAFGGPHLGFFAAKKKFVRKMPGRLVGQTVDKDGRRGWVLTLQTREQHIRREKATSNICTNQALCAFRAMAYLTAVGKEGFLKVANLCLQKAHYAAGKLAGLDGFELAFDGPFFREFAVRTPVPPEELNARLADKGFIPGLPLARFSDDWKDLLLVAVTEKHTKDAIDGLAEAIGGVL